MQTVTMIAFAALAAMSATHTSVSAQTTDDASVLRLLTCQDSWLEWKNDPAQQQKFVDTVKANFKQNGRDGLFVPIKPMAILGLDVVQLYPQSVGMGVGYSVVVNASFDMTKAALEKQLGKPFAHCESATEGRSCERELAKQKTVMMVEGSRGSNPKTLFGCYYLYEK